MVLMEHGAGHTVHSARPESDTSGFSHSEVLFPAMVSSSHSSLKLFTLVLLTFWLLQPFFPPPILLTAVTTLKGDDTMY
jgi:hypothetical protein